VQTATLQNGLYDYSYGFNGMEKDDEIKGAGNSLDFGARILDVRVGRWLSGDPLESNYPDMSTYSFNANSPMVYMDPDGKKIKIYYDSDETDDNDEPIMKTYDYKSGMKKPKDKYVRKTVRALNKMYRSKSYDQEGIVKALTNDEDNTIAIHLSEEGNGVSTGRLVKRMSNGTGKVLAPDGFEFKVLYNPNVGYISEDGTQRQSAGMTLLHELGHQYYTIFDPEGCSQEFYDALKTGNIIEFVNVMEGAIGDYETYSDKWIIENVENPVKSEGNRENHNSGKFLKTWFGVFSKRGNKARDPGEEEFTRFEPEEKEEETKTEDNDD
jgi:RHS repeat-associated protein